VRPQSTLHAPDHMGIQTFFWIAAATKPLTLLRSLLDAGGRAVRRPSRPPPLRRPRFHPVTPPRLVRRRAEPRCALLESADAATHANDAELGSEVSLDWEAVRGVL